MATISLQVTRREPRETRGPMRRSDGSILGLLHTCSSVGRAGAGSTPRSQERPSPAAQHPGLFVSFQVTQKSGPSVSCALHSGLPGSSGGQAPITGNPTRGTSPWGSCSLPVAPEATAKTPAQPWCNDRWGDGLWWVCAPLFSHPMQTQSVKN